MKLKGESGKRYVTAKILDKAPKEVSEELEYILASLFKKKHT